MRRKERPKKWRQIPLWDTNPDTFVAQEAVKRHDLRRCHLSDDVIMKLAINKREKTLHNADIDVFESVSLKSLRIRERRKRRGAPAFAPDGTVMSIMTGHSDNDRLVLNGGDGRLLDGGWTVENYHTKSDYPGYKEWLSRIVWTADEAVNKGIPREAINTPFPDITKVTNRNLFEDLRLGHLNRADDSQPNINDNINDNSNHNINHNITVNHSINHNNSVQDEQAENMAATPIIERVSAGSELSPATNVQDRAVEPQDESFESQSPTPDLVQTVSSGMTSEKSEANVKLVPRTGSIDHITGREASPHKSTKNPGVNTTRVRTSTASLMADTVSSSVESEGNMNLKPRTGSIEQITRREASRHNFTITPVVNAARVRTSTASLMADKTNTKSPLTTHPSTNRPLASLRGPRPAAGQAGLPQTASPAPVLPNPLKRKAIDLCDRTITFKVKEAKLKHGDEVSFSFSESLLLKKAPAFYTDLKKSGKQLHRNGPPIFEVTENPKYFEAILYWVDHGVVMGRPYLAHCDLEAYYLNLYRLAVEDYELPGLANAVIDALHEWYSQGGIVLGMIDEVYGVTASGEGLREFYFDCLLEMSTEEFEGMVIEEGAVSMDLFEAAKRGVVGHGVKSSEAYHNFF